MLTHRELHGQMQAFAAGLQSLGLHAGDRVSLFSDNSSRWLVADQGVMMLGAADAVSCLQCLLAMWKCTLPYLALFPGVVPCNAIGSTSSLLLLVPCSGHRRSCMPLVCRRPDAQVLNIWSGQ